ncbi:MAG: LbtU family siderophore porin [Chlorobiales bacterium]|jgi:hypothetical protein|nr:LbtU family siderophore porin [Chlorobiales bacterium]
MHLLNKTALLAFLSLALSSSLRAAESDIEKAIQNSASGRMLSFSGYVEAEYSYLNVAGRTAFNFFLSAFELGLEAKVADWITAHGFLLYEEDTDDLLLVDEAYIRLQQKASPFFAEAGRFTQSFGKFETGMISDPLTLQLGETKHHASLKAGFAQGTVSASLSIWKGDLQKEGKSELNGLVAAVSLADMVNESLRYEVGGSWTNNIGDTDGLQKGFQAANYATTDFVSGYSFYAIARLGSFDVRGEVLAAATRFKDGARAGSKPAAWNIEMGYAMVMPLHVALRYAGASEFRIRQQYGATGAYDLAVGTRLALEYLHHEYDDRTQGDKLTVQLAMKF